jgi:2-oxoglutarate dehydrogenase E1 component
MRDGDEYVPLEHLFDGQPRFQVIDSILSEAAVLGFEYGYNAADPNMLVMWEAQFGDFANGAQTIIDQFIGPGELKWERWSGITLLLPHGYEGAGPEHSSGRMERFLQLTGNENIQVVYPSTAAQCFHMFRRQLKQPRSRKPLIVFTPKSMLRVPTGTIEELTKGHFQNLLDDPAFVAGKADRKGVRRVVLCSGKIYFELAARRDALAKHDTAIVRVEQFYPFDLALAKRILALYPAAASKVWVQEEPRNAGGYLFVADISRSELETELSYIGRATCASPATGSKHLHKDQQEAILTEAIGPMPAKAVESAKSGNGAAKTNGTHDATASKSAPSKARTQH